MCNLWNNEHTFLYTGSTTNATDWQYQPHAFHVCQCGRLTWAEAKGLALKALYDAEERRQKEREQEASYWAGL